MRRFREILESLTRAPLGHVADGQRMGIGLAAAMARAEQQLPDEVEKFLRAKADARNVTS